MGGSSLATRYSIIVGQLVIGASVQKLSLRKWVAGRAGGRSQSRAGGIGSAARLLLRLPTSIHFAVVAWVPLDHIAPEHVVAVIRERNWELPGACVKLQIQPDTLS